MKQLYNITEQHKDIDRLRSKLGNQLVILGHHYQEQGVIDHCDYTGDSLELSQHIAHLDAKHIIFCGVFFMAESAALLAQKDQFVYLPEPSANCIMSLMSPAELIDIIFKKLTKSGRKIIPIAYVNTTLDVKAVVGKHGGSLCTSSSAEKVLRWAMQQGDGVFFVPDKNLAYNTAKRIGIDKKDIHLLDIRKKGEAANLDAANNASLILWPGLCAIHTRFMMSHIHTVREDYPGCTIIVHPECTPDVVQASNNSGSTSFIIDYTKNMPDGMHLVIGTEFNLVQRLAQKHKSRLTVTPLRTSSCSHMAKGTPTNLLETLYSIVDNNSTPIKIEPTTAMFAKESLERMFKIVN